MDPPSGEQQERAADGGHITPSPPPPTTTTHGGGGAVNQLQQPMDPDARGAASPSPPTLAAASSSSGASGSSASSSASRPRTSLLRSLSAGPATTDEEASQRPQSLQVGMGGTGPGILTSAGSMRFQPPRLPHRSGKNVAQSKSPVPPQQGPRAHIRPPPLVLPPSPPSKVCV